MRKMFLLLVAAILVMLAALARSAEEPVRGQTESSLCLPVVANQRELDWNYGYDGREKSHNAVLPEEFIGWSLFSSCESGKLTSEVASFASKGWARLPYGAGPNCFGKLSNPDGEVVYTLNPQGWLKASGELVLVSPVPNVWNQVQTWKIEGGVTPLNTQAVVVFWERNLHEVVFLQNGIFTFAPPPEASNWMSTLLRLNIGGDTYLSEYVTLGGALPPP